MKITILLIILACSILGGCVITNTPGFYSGYKKLIPSEKAKIQFLSKNQPLPYVNDHLIYALDAYSMLNIIQHNDTSLIYIWGPQCHSQSCASLQSVQSVCTKKKYRLYVIAQYYDMEQISIQPKIENPLLAINQQYYKADYCDKYTRLFTSELTMGKQLPDSLKYSRYYLFCGNRFIKAINMLNDVQPQFLPRLLRTRD